MPSAHTAYIISIIYAVVPSAHSDFFLGGRFTLLSRAGAHGCDFCHYFMANKVLRVHLGHVFSDEN